jgi:hypothetical protein
MPALNHGSTIYATPVDKRTHTISNMVQSVWHRLEELVAVKPLTVVAVRDLFGFSYQAAVKLHKGGGLGPENLLKVSKKYGVSPEWLATGKGSKTPTSAMTPPPAPSSGAGPFSALTADEMAFLDDVRWLLDSDRERYRAEIAAKAKELREHMGKVMSTLQPPPTIKGKK